MTPNSAKLLNLLLNKINEYIEESNGNKYLTLVPTDIFQTYVELWGQIKDVIRSTNKNPDDCDKKYVKINSDEDLPLKKILEFLSIIIVVKSVFQKDNKYYPQVFLDESLYKLAE